MSVCVCLLLQAILDYVLTFTLVFRREPVWQVTMNLKVKPTVKCTFDDEETTLRIIAIEQLEEGKHEPVIYALRVSLGFPL